MKIESYQDLIVWQKSMDLVEMIYGLTRQLPEHEKYALSSQMQRAAVSIPSNIAEGNLRRYQKEYSHFISIALGSAAELETQLLVCRRVHRFNDGAIDDHLGLVSEIKKMLYVILSKLT